MKVGYQLQKRRNSFPQAWMEEKVFGKQISNLKFIWCVTVGKSSILPSLGHAFWFFSSGLGVFSASDRFLPLQSCFLESLITTTSQRSSLLFLWGWNHCSSCKYWTDLWNSPNARTTPSLLTLHSRSHALKQDLSPSRLHCRPNLKMGSWSMESVATQGVNRKQNQLGSKSFSTEKPGDWEANQRSNDRINYSWVYRIN